MYTSPIVMFQLIPCLNYIVWAWYLPVLGIGYTRVHEQDGWKSAAAVVAPVLGCCCCYIGLITFSIAAEGL